jgi:PhzF family phenazine biosynthesis protein
LEVLRISAFSENGTCGNPAGVLIADAFSSDTDMQRIASEIGYSETAFAVRSGSDRRVRYVSPKSEVPLCGMPPSPWARCSPCEKGQASSRQL